MTYFLHFELLLLGRSCARIPFLDYL